MRAAPARWWLVVLVPLLISAADPRDDVGGCRGGEGDGAPDLVEARGEIVELGTSARWELTFSEPLVMPDVIGRPFRVDIAIHDPAVRAYTFAHYRDVNRLVRVDATVDHRTEILLLPERAQNVFNPPVVDGRSMTIQVPGRTLSADEDLTGTSPGLEALRWTVIVRDGRACDVLRGGRPTERLVMVAERSSSPEHVPAPGGISAWWVVAGASVALVGIGAYVVRRVR